MGRFIVDDDIFFFDCVFVKVIVFFVEGFVVVGLLFFDVFIFKDLFNGVGFVSYDEKWVYWFSNFWFKDKKFKEIVMWFNINFFVGVEGFLMVVVICFLGWSLLEVIVFFV